MCCQNLNKGIKINAGVCLCVCVCVCVCVCWVICEYVTLRTTCVCACVLRVHTFLCGPEFKGKNDTNNGII